MIEAFFRDHSHCTKFNGEQSDFLNILASIIQGSAIGPASYVITASDLHPVTSGNSMHKYADDTYLVVPADNIHSSVAEISHVEKWAGENNLVLNFRKSVEIVFVPPRSRRAIEVPAPAVPNIARVDMIKALGVTISRKFSMSHHVENLLASCAQTLFALRTLRQHGLSTSAVHTVFKATVVAKLSYASSAWWGFTSVDDRNRLEAFLRRSARLGYRLPTDVTFTNICEQSDETLFNSIKHNANHLLYPLLPQERISSQHYSLRQRSHNFQISMRTTTLNDNNFLNRMLFRGLSNTSDSQVSVLL